MATSKAALTGAFSTKVKASVEYERAGGAGVETRWTEPAAFSRTDRMLQYNSSAMAAYAVTEAGPTATTMATAVAAASDIAALKPATVAAREKYHPEDLSHRTRAKLCSSPNIRLGSVRRGSERFSDSTDASSECRRSCQPMRGPGRSCGRGWRPSRPA